jgi:hypothetical protein
MTVNINKPQINLREQLKKLERPTTDKLAVKGHNGVLLDPLTGELNLQGIDSSVGGAAYDVFVYDTSKDSDGGAWRKRTQSTSWYNETLNTSTRGSRKEFPAVAVIISDVSSDKVIIYDADDPDLPMWMVFSGTNPRGILSWSTTNLTRIKVSALNGILATATNDGGHLFKFIEDFVEINYGSTNYPITTSRTIGGRNDPAAYVGGGGATRTNVVLTYNQNDIAMTVLPNAPIDSATGLPVPTIAVGTTSGTAVIKDDGTVVDYTGFNPSEKVAIDSKYVYSATRSGTNDYIFKSPFLSTDANYDVTITAGSGGWYANSVNNGSETPTLKNMTVTDVAITKDSSIIRSGNDGIEVFDGNVTTIDANEAELPIAYITSDYNTGWMHGDIQGAFLSDADLLDSELITNGTFGSNIDNWRSFNATLSHATDSIRVGDGPGSWSKAYQSFATVVGKQYQVKIVVKTISGGTATASVGAQNPAKLSGNDTTIINSLSSTGTYFGYFTATATTSYVEMASDGTSYVDYSEVSVRNAVVDRSLKSNNLRQYGNITKSAVATGAELVAYSGFSASNYLTTPQVATHNFGSSGSATICFMSWVKQSTTGEYSYIISVQDGTSTAPVGMAVHTSTGNFYVYEGTDVKSSSTNIVDGNWHHCVGIIDGTNVVGYVDGNEVINTTTSNPPNLSGIDRFNIGHFRSGTSNLYHNRGSLSLSRISKSIPSPEQIKKMYEDEKGLFQENAKATLYGSSDAVTALAYDDTTSLLHVGTSGGRSTFSGLKRVENTTTAVATAISASNGLVAEQ